MSFFGLSYYQISQRDHEFVTMYPAIISIGHAFNGDNSITCNTVMNLQVPLKKAGYF
jgi:hypothetical protein